MKQRLLFWALLLTLLLALLGTGPVLARENDGGPLSPPQRGLYADKIVFGGSYTLESGERLDGNLIVFGGNVTLEEDSEVDGDVVVMGGNLEANGTIDGDISCIGGNVNLRENAVVNGNVNVIGGANLNRSEGSEVLGNIERDGRVPFDYSFNRRGAIPGLRVSVTPLANALWFMFQAFFWAGLAVLLVMFLPVHVERTADAAVRQPLITGSVGLLTLLVAVFLLPILAITIILLPASLLGALVLAIAWLFGTAALGLEVGRRIERQFRQEWPLAVSAGIGTFVFVLVVFGVSKIVPCVGWLFPILAGMVAVGAVLLTRFGVQPYPPVMAGGSGPTSPAGGPSWSSPPPHTDEPAPPAPDIDEADWQPIPPDEPTEDQ